MRRHVTARLISCAIAAAIIVATFGGAKGTLARTQAAPLAANAFANSAFQSTWDRTDHPASQGQVKRSFYWGPRPNTAGMQEEYAEGPGGKRLVQYFDKSRMEINNPNGDPNDPFFVTNGLLTVELISGQNAGGQ